MNEWSGVGQCSCCFKLATCVEMRHLCRFAVLKQSVCPFWGDYDTDKTETTKRRQPTTKSQQLIDLHENSTKNLPNIEVETCTYMGLQKKARKQDGLEKRHTSFRKELRVKGALKHSLLHLPAATRSYRPPLSPLPPPGAAAAQC